MIRHMTYRLSAAFLALLLGWVPASTAFARGMLISQAGTYTPQRLTVGVGTGRTFWEVLAGISAFLATAIIFVSGALFVIGAFMIMVSGVKEDMRQRGKDFLIGSALGIIVVLGAYALFRTVNCFLTPGCAL
jgi:hypothetical protein